MTWIIYQINKKTKIPKKFADGTNDKKLPSIIEGLQKDKEYIYAIRFNLDKPGE